MCFWPFFPCGWFSWKVVIQDLELDRSKPDSPGWSFEKWEGKFWGTTVYYIVINLIVWFGEYLNYLNICVIWIIGVISKNSK